MEDTKSSPRPRKISTGYRLSRDRRGSLRRYLTSASSILQGQSYEPRTSGSRSPFALFSLERYVQSGGTASKQARAICAAFDGLAHVEPVAGSRPIDIDEAIHILTLLYGPQSQRDSLRGVREPSDVGGSCNLCGLWCEEKKREKGTLKPDGAPDLVECDWCREFGDAVLIVRSTEAARARARVAWPAWMCNEKAWRGSHRSRVASEQLEAEYAAKISAHRARDAAGAGLELAEDPGPFTLQEDLALSFDEGVAYRDAKFARRAALKTGHLYPGCSMSVVGEMLRDIEERRERDYELDAIAEDVIERAICKRTAGDDLLLQSIRAEANERIAIASKMLSTAWDAVDDADRAEEKKQVEGDQDAPFRQAIRRRASRDRAPSARVSRESLGDLMRFQAAQRGEP